VAPTPILDWDSQTVQAFSAELRSCPEADADSQALLVLAHRLIAERVRPVYALDETQPASRTLERGRGSCSQRLAVLEAAARASGIPTRVRGLLVDGRFWYPRFPRLRFAVPDVIVLAWPEFELGGRWTSVSELFGSLDSVSAAGFTNADGETLFDAVARTAVDWDGATSTPSHCSACDLSANVVRDLGRFDSRDDLFRIHGQTLNRVARKLAGLVLDRCSAGA
jgi:transglutaminase-like putative cysteine protease